MMQAIFFDAVGTLIHPQPSAGAVYYEIGRQFGTRYEPNVMAERFRQAFIQQEAIDRASGWRTSEQRELRRWRAIVAQVLDDTTNREACFAALYEHFARPESWRCDPVAEELLRELEGRGWVLGLASNYDHRLHSVLKGLPEIHRLRHTVISSETGWRKPAREFFEAIGETVGLALESIWYVGDDRANDFEGAVAAGMPALLLDKGGNHRDLGNRALGNLTALRRFLGL